MCHVPLTSSGLEWGVMQGLQGTSSEENISFCSQNDKFVRILPQFLTGRKHRSLETRILQFNREITKLTKNSEIIQKFTVRQGRGGRTIPPEYATA